jgi:hypothetical protein
VKRRARTPRLLRDTNPPETTKKLSGGATMLSKFLFATALISLLASPAAAQNPPQGTRTFVRGTVEKLDGQALKVKSREGPELTIALAPNFTVSGVVKRSLADIKAGDYVASTSVRGTDGKLHAIEVHIFPEAMRGTAEGQFPWDLVPDSIMTNATVAGISSAPQGQVLKVTYKGGEAEVIVPNNIPIVTYAPGDASLLKPGAAIFMVALKQPDGTLTATRVTAEKDGVKPPM